MANRPLPAPAMEDWRTSTDLAMDERIRPRDGVAEKKSFVMTLPILSRPRESAAAAASASSGEGVDRSSVLARRDLEGGGGGSTYASANGSGNPSEAATRASGAQVGGRRTIGIEVIEGVCEVSQGRKWHGQYNTCVRTYVSDL